MTKQAKKPLSAAKKRAIAAMRAGAKASAEQRKLDRQADADKARYKQPKATKAAQPNYGKSIIERSNEIDLNKGVKMTKADIVKASRQAAEDKASQARDQVNADIAKRVMKDFVVGKPPLKTATPPVAVFDSATYKDQVGYMWDLLHLLIGLSIVNPNLALRIYKAAYPDK